MALTVADLLAKLSLDTSGFRKGAEEATTASKKVEDAAAKVGQSTEGAGESAKKGGKGLGDLSAKLNETTQKFTELLTPANLFGTVIGVVVVAAIRNAIAATTEYAQEMQRLQLVTGGTMGQIGELEDASSKLGIGTEKLKRAFFFLSSEIETGGRNLAKLGISIRDDTGAQRESLDIMAKVSEKFHGMTNETEKNVAAKKLLSRQAVDMLPLFELERKQLEQLGESGREFGERFGKDGVKGAILFGGAISEVGEAIGRAQKTIVMDFAPGVKLLADLLSQVLDLFWKIPPPIRLIIETLIAAGLAFVALKIAMVALAPVIAAARLAMVAFGISTGVALSPVALIALGLAALLILGPPLAALLAKLIPQFVIDAWESFYGWVSKTWTILKNFMGFTSAPPAPEPPKTDREKTLAEMQIELALNNRLRDAQSALARVTQDATSAAILGSKNRQQSAIDEINIELSKLSADKNADASIKAERAKLEEAKSLIIQTGAAERVHLYAQEQLELLTIEKQTNEQWLALEAVRRQSGLAIRVDEIEQAKKLVKDEFDNFGISQAGYVDETIRLNGLELKAKQDALGKEMQEVLADQKLKQKAIEDDARVNLKTAEWVAAKSLELQTTTEVKLAAARAKGTTEDLASAKENTALKQELANKEYAFVAQAENRDLTLKIANMEAYKHAHADNVNAVMAADAQLFQVREEGYNRDVKNAIDAELKKTTLYQSEVQKQIAIQAGVIDKLKQARDKELQDTATVLEQQARLAGDIDAAFDVGFAHAATSADDAFAAMRKAGAESFQSLKSGLSDYLFAVFTGAKGIGDIFVNLGKRILRSMTDAFAAILAKQLAMSAGFSFTGFLGLGTAVAGAAGMEGAPNAAAQAITSLGTAATGSADALSGMTGILGLVMRVLMFFANGLMGILGFFGQIVQGIASGGGIVNTLTSAFGGLVKSGGALYSIFNGLSNVGSALFSVFTQGTSLATVFQTAFNALGLTSGGFASAAGAASWGAATSATGGAPLAAGQLTGSFASFLGQWVPIAGALYMAAMAIQNFLNGDAAVKIGTAIGTLILPGFGSWLGGIIGGLFSPTPKAAVSASILPFDRNNIHDALRVSVSGNALKGSDENKLAEQLIVVLTEILSKVVDATVSMMKVLPPSLAAELETALAALETNGLDFLGYTKFKGSKAAKKLLQFAETLPDLMIQALSENLGFGETDLQALGGGKVGDAAKGFEGLLLAVAGLSAIVKEVGPGVDLAGVSLAQFTTGAIDLFKSFAKEGEAFIDTVKRIMTAFQGLIDLQASITTRIQALTGDAVGAIASQGKALMRMIDNIVSLADALSVAVNSAASPEDVLAAAQALLQAYDAAIQVAQQLKAQLDALNSAITNGVDLIVSLTQKIDTLRGQELSAGEFQFGLDGIIALWNQLTDVNSRIALFAAALVGASENLSLLTANIPLAVAGFNTIMAQIKEIENPAEAMAALKGLAGAVEAGLSAAVASVNRQTQARIAALNAEKTALGQANAAAKTALEQEKTALSAVFDVRKQALQDELQMAQQWAGIVTSAKAQLVDLFNLLAPTHPLTSLNEVRAQFDTAFAAFQAAPTTGGATGVQDLARQLLQLAQQTPGYDLPSAAFQSLAASVRTALEAIQTFAAAQPSQEEIQAQIATLEAEQAASLASIDTRIQALDASQTAALAAIDAEIAAATAAGQAQIQEFQNLAAAGLEAIRAQVVIEVTALAVQQAAAAAALHEILGDQTFEQFIIQKQHEAVLLLQGINDTLDLYLRQLVQQFVPGAIIQTVIRVPLPVPVPYTPPPQLAGGMDYVPSDRFPAYLDRGEGVLTASENSSYQSGKSGGTKTVTITLAPTIQIQGGSSSQMKSDLDKALVELVNGPSLTRPALLELAKRAS